MKSFVGDGHDGKEKGFFCLVFLTKPYFFYLLIYFFSSFLFGLFLNLLFYRSANCWDQRLSKVEMILSCRSNWLVLFCDFLWSYSAVIWL